MENEQRSSSVDTRNPWRIVFNAKEHIFCDTVGWYVNKESMEHAVIILHDCMIDIGMENLQ